jgi:lipopolysaccharide export system protein LptC
MKNRIVSLILLPLAIVLWMIGWSMLLAAFNKEQKNRPTRKKTTPEESQITVMPIMPEEIEA